MTDLTNGKKGRGCCMCTSIVFASLFFTIGLIIILAGFMRYTIINKRYSPIECNVENKEIREIRGVCVASKCSPSKFEGNVEFKLTDNREIWTIVITSYNRDVVSEYMNNHFILGSETRCYLDKNSHLIFRLHPTLALLIFSILFLLIGLLIYFLVLYWGCKRRRKGYKNLDLEIEEGPFKL